MHHCRWGNGLAVKGAKVEPPLHGEADIGIFAAMPYVPGTAFGDGEHTGGATPNRMVARRRDTISVGVSAPFRVSTTSLLSISPAGSDAGANEHNT